MTTEKSLTIAVKARDEASQKFDSIGGSLRKMAGSPVGKLVGGFFAVQTVAKAAAAAVMGLVAASEQSKAVMTGSAEKILESQLKINVAWGEFAGAIPAVGEAAKKAVDAWNNADGIRKQIEEIKKLKGEVEKYGAAVVKAEREAAIARAEGRGASASEVAEIRGRFAMEDQQKPLDDMDKTIETLKTKVAGLQLDLGLGIVHQGKSARVMRGELRDMQSELERALDARKRLAKAQEDISAGAARKRQAQAAAERNKAEDDAAAYRDSLAAARRQEEQDRAAMARSVTDLDLAAPERAMDRELEASQRKYAAMREQARAWVVDEEERQRYLTRVAKAEAEDRARIYDANQKRQDDLRRQSAEKEMARAAAVADAEDALGDSILSQLGMTAEVQIRQIKREAAALREKFGGNEEMQALIDASEKLKLRDTQKETPMQSREVSVQNTRMLTRIQGVAEPAWVKRQEASQQRSTQEIVKALGAVAPELASAIQRGRSIGVLSR